MFKFLFAMILLPVLIVLIKLMWAFTVPDIFPGAVKQGLVAETLSWVGAVKLTVLSIILGIFTMARR